MNEQELLKKLGQRIKELRSAKGITQQELAIKAFDSDKSNISRLEAGKVNASIFTLYKISQVLQIPLAEITNID